MVPLFSTYWHLVYWGFWRPLWRHHSIWHLAKIPILNAVLFLILVLCTLLQLELDPLEQQWQFWINITSTGWISDIWKKVQANILKDPLVLMKQKIPQQKALDLSFNLAPWKWVWHYHEAATPSWTKRSQKPSAPTYAFHGKEAWCPPDNATPILRVPN